MLPELLIDGDVGKLALGKIVLPRASAAC